MARADSAELLDRRDEIGRLRLTDGIERSARSAYRIASVSIDAPPGLAGDRAKSAACLPVAKDFGRDAAAAGPRFALSNRKLVDVSNLEDMWRIEPSLSSVAPEDVRVVPVEPRPSVIVS